MKTQLQCKPTAAEHFPPANATFRKAGHTTTGVAMVTTFLGVVAAAFYGLFFTGSCLIQPAHENLRASQIIMQRAEALQLFTGSQACDTSICRQPLTAPGVSTKLGGVQYAGQLSAVTLTLSWTNYTGAKPIVHKREIQTRLARNGMPKYIWGAL